MYFLLFHLLIIMFTHNILPIHLGSIDDTRKTGLDERYIYNPNLDNNTPSILDIQSYIHKMRILDILTQQDVSIHIKLQAYDSYSELSSSSQPKLYNGNLIDDWNFDF